LGSAISIGTYTLDLHAGKGSDRVTIRDLLPFDPSTQQTAGDTGDLIASNSSLQQTPANQTVNVSPGEHTITVKGTGSLQIKPDLATVYLSIITSKDTEKATLDANLATFDKVLNFLTKNVTNIKAQSSNVSAGNASSAFMTDISIKQDNLSKYTVARKMVFSTSELANIPEWITEAGKLGANRIDSIQLGLTSDTMDKERINVMEKAMGDAWFNARDAAILLGVRVVGVKSLTVDNFDVVEHLSYPEGISLASISAWYQYPIPSVSLEMNLTQSFLF
jgi:uncharacterized protein